MRRLFFLVVFFCAFTALFTRGAWPTFYGDFPTGLLQLEEKYLYYLFVPAAYSPDKFWPLLIVVENRGKDPKKVIGAWVDWAEKNQIFILAPSNNMPEKDIPEKMDQWLFEIKREVMERYHIDPRQVLLVGMEDGAHYAAYLGTNYPQEFSAAALFREAWVGPFEKIIRPTAQRKKQIAFYLALDPEEENFSAAEAKALEFEKKGYVVTLDPLKAGEEFAAVRERMIQWFHGDFETRTLLKEKPRTTFKEKTKSFLGELIEVKF